MKLYIFAPIFYILKHLWLFQGIRLYLDCKNRCLEILKLNLLDFYGFLEHVKGFAMVLKVISFVDKTTILHLQSCFRSDHVIFCGHLHVCTLQVTKGSLRQVLH
jgi:hypothetical protein